jgi:heparan-alpha-glucosaminide N-acetyltransferase
MSADCSFLSRTKTTLVLPRMNPSSAAPVSARITSVDAYRGFVMLLMMGVALRLRTVARALPESGAWRFLAWHQSHVEWTGCSLHDLIQPSFSFLVGVALPFSIAHRLARGESHGRLTLHAVWRALLLILLGVFLRSASRSSTYWTFEDTLSQIGLGYFFLYSLGLCTARAQWIAFGAVVAGYWAAFACWPLPVAGFDYAAVGVNSDWLSTHGLTGFAAHWQKNSNLAWAFDTWWLNLFPRGKPFSYNGGGYATLSFIPTLGTMILGLIAGGVLRRELTAAAKVRWFGIAGVVGLAIGAALGWLGVCPVVKRIWTPSWTLFSGGWCFLLLGLFYLVVDAWAKRRLAFPLVVVGLNSIAAYVIADLCESFIQKSLVTHLGSSVFMVFGAPYRPLLEGAGTLAVLWLLLWWMYRRKIFLRI